MAKKDEIPEVDAPEKEAEKVNLVKMTRADGLVAEVHPDEVHDYAKGGYVKE